MADEKILSTHDYVADIEETEAAFQELDDEDVKAVAKVSSWVNANFDRYCRPNGVFDINKVSAFREQVEERFRDEGLAAFFKISSGPQGSVAQIEVRGKLFGDGTMSPENIARWEKEHGKKLER